MAGGYGSRIWLTRSTLDKHIKIGVSQPLCRIPSDMCAAFVCRVLEFGKSLLLLPRSQVAAYKKIPRSFPKLGQGLP